MTKKNISAMNEMDKVSGGMIYDPDRPPRPNQPLGTLKSVPKDPLPDPIVDILFKMHPDK